MADDLARVRSVDVAVDDLIVLDDHDAVAVALQEGAQLIAAGTVVFVHQKLGAVTVFDVFDLHQVVGVNALACAAGGELGALLRRFVSGDDMVVFKNGEHALEDIHKALAARVHNAGLFQHRQLLGRVVQRALGGGAHQLPQLHRVRDAAGRGFLAGHTGHRQHRALGGFHHGLVCALNAFFQRLHKVLCIGCFFALQRLGKAAEQQAGNNAGVAAGAS